MIKTTDIEKANSLISTTDIKGKNYAEVHERIKAFRSICPDGEISTEIVNCDGKAVVIKATVKDGEGHVLGTGHGREVDGDSFINKTSYIENCVPLDSEILTDKGWKFYYQLKDDDKAVAVDLETGKMEYAEITAVHTYKDRPITELSTSRFFARCTPDHKWIVQANGGEILRRKTSELRVSDKILQVYEQKIAPSEIGAKLGWMICDSELNTTRNRLPSRVEIRQSKHIDEIDKLFGKGEKVKKQNDKWQDNYRWNVPAETVRDVYGYFDIRDYRDLERAMAKATIEDVQGCYNSMMLADGSRGTFETTYPELIKAMQVMCARIGVATTHVTSRKMKNSTKPIYRLGIKNTTGAYYSEMKVKNIPPQDVWCPETSTHTWIMKQGDFISLTSNCETSAVGRALGMVGIGIQSAFASADEVGNAKLQQEGQKTITKDKAKNLSDFAKMKGMTDEQALAEMGVERYSQVTVKQYAEFIKRHD